MKKLKQIYEIIDNESIILEEVIFKNNIEGIYFKMPDLNPTIGISEAIVTDSKAYISILAEELGHHFTTFNDLTAECITYSDRLLRCKSEFKARRWATDFLISDDEFKLALEYPSINFAEMSDYFNVTNEIIRMKILTLSYNEIKFKNMKLDFREHEFQYNACCI